MHTTKKAQLQSGYIPGMICTRRLYNEAEKNGVVDI
jgi:hypothetical protein